MHPRALVQELQSYVRLVALRSIRLTVTSALLNSIIRLNCTQAPEPRRAEAKALQFRSARESPAIKLMEIIGRRRASTGF